MDAAGFSKEAFDRIKSDAQEIIKLLHIQPGNIIPVSAQKGDNIFLRSQQMNWYKGLSLIGALDKITLGDILNKSFLRFPVQDIYVIDNRRIAVGRVASGMIKSGEAVTIQPQGASTKVKSLEVFEGKIKNADSGQSIGVVVEEGSSLGRGQIICDKMNQPRIDSRIMANIFWLDSERLKLDGSFRIKCATFEDNCRIQEIYERIDSSTFEVIEKNSSFLEETQVGKVAISIDKSMAYENFNDIEELGRFVLLKDNHVCAGGIITE
jgi:sulfate adenylyltransferase subunit 1 (EFTu-like GTPase family)